MNYTPLSVKTEYSLLRGLSKCEQVANRINSIDSKACAITDIESVSGAVDFSKEMDGKDIKPILGTDLGHSSILSKNIDGWKDLLKIVSVSDMPQNDRIKAMASRDNLISFSGKEESSLAQALVGPDWKKNGIVEAKRLSNIFGKDNFFIEIQSINPKLSGMLRDISKATDIPCVATPEAYYCEQADSDDQHILLSTLLKKDIGSIVRNIKKGEVNKNISRFFDSNNYYLPSHEEMSSFHTDEELANTNIIADMCDGYSILKNPEPPEFKCPGGLSPAEYLRKLCRDGWGNKMKGIDTGSDLFKTYGSRVDMELDVFTSVGLSSYFLIVMDILNYVRSKGNLVGPGRGSSSGCMVSYLLDITQVDPIKYDLMFERFYNAGRNAPGKVSWPDIDFDVPKSARADAVSYIHDKYGNENVGSIITFQTLKGKAALTRVMAARGNIEFAEQKAITKCLQDEAKVSDELKDIEEEYGHASSILWALEHTPAKLKPWCHLKDGKIEGRLSKVFEQAIRIENTKIIAGTHAAGVVVSRNPISDSCPMVESKDGGVLAGFEGPMCEQVGLLKLDCLAIRGLDKVMDIVKILKGE